MKELQKMLSGLKNMENPINSIHCIGLDRIGSKVPPIVQVMISFFCAVGLASIITAMLKKFKLTRALYGV